MFNFSGIRLQLGKGRPLVIMAEANMVERLDSNQLVDMLSKKGLPIVGGDKNSAIFCPSKLADIDSSRCVDDAGKVSQPSYFGAPVSVYIV